MRRLAVILAAIVCLFGIPTNRPAHAEHITSFEGAMRPVSPAAGWEYLWNSNGLIGDPANYSPLLATPSPWYFYDADGVDGLPGAPDPAGYICLGLLDLSRPWPGVPGGSPGLGYQRPGAFGIERFAIAVYTVPRDGFYSIANSNLMNADESEDGLHLSIYVGNSHSLVLEEFTDPGLFEYITFDISLGYLTAGEKIYVAIGPNGTDYYDAFRLEYSIDAAEPAVLMFYNNSAWDDDNGAANAADANAIAAKVALRPGNTATFANYTSYDKGINGLMIDLYGLPGTPTVNDFLFRYGNDDQPYGEDLNDPDDDWLWAPDPIAIAVRPGAGQDGADRVTLIWEDGLIRNCWLQVTVLATGATGLARNEVFYVGNAGGESGNSTTGALVNATDEIGSRNHPHSPFNPAPKDDHYDFNRDRLVNATDQIIARNNRTNPFTVLRLITPPLEGQ